MQQGLRGPALWVPQTCWDPGVSTVQTYAGISMRKQSDACVGIVGQEEVQAVPRRLLPEIPWLWSLRVMNCETMALDQVSSRSDTL